MEILEYLNEEWRDIPGFENRYQASSFGRIRSLRYEGHNEVRILKLQKRQNYWRVALHNGKTTRYYTVSRLVWSTFNGPIPEGMQVNHIDENTDNNSIFNLNLMSAKENSNWGTRNERGRQKRIRGKHCKPVVQCDLDGNVIKEWISAQEVYNELHYFKSAICRCCQGAYGRKTYKGYIWKYKN